MASDTIPEHPIRQNLVHCFIPGCTAYVGWNDVAFFNMSFGDLPHWWKGTAWAEKYQTELPIDAKICEMHFEERFIDRSKKKPRLIMGTIPTLRLALLEKITEDSNCKEYLCRLCAKKSNQRLNARLDKLPGLEKIVECCLGMYKNQFGLPIEVCDHCMQTINKFSNFVKNCEKSQALLLQAMETDMEKITEEVKNASSTTNEIDERLSINISREKNTESDMRNANNSLSNVCENKMRRKSVWNSCLDCGKTFKNSTNYYIHLETRNDNENDFVCQVCDKKFKQRCGLEYHLRRNHNEKQSDCKDTRGQKNNSNEKDSNFEPVSDEHKCTQCAKTFSSPANLRVHLLSHNVPKLKCEICDAVFRSKHLHMQHILQVHTLEIKRDKDLETPRKRPKKGIQIIRLAEKK